MSILSPAQIASFRGLMQSLAMPDTFEVLRPGAPVSNGYGGQTPGPDVVASTGACLVKEQPTGAEQQIAASLQVVRPVVVELPVATDVKESDRLRVNGVRTLNVIAVDRGGNFSMTYTVVASEVT